MSIILDGTNGIVTPDIDSGVSTLGPLTQALNLGSTGQVVFPATQNASANANTLDDYEEGTWTPSYSGTGGGSTTHSVQTGTYTKIGNMVFFVGVLRAARGTLSGNIEILGLPFTSTSTNGEATGGLFKAFARAFASDMPNFSGWVRSNSTRIALYKQAMNAAASNQVAPSDLSTDSTGDNYLIFTGMYRTIN